MRVLALALALVVAIGTLSPRDAAANKSIGVLVTGEYLKKPTLQIAEKWLRGHGHKVVTTPMPRDAVKTLLDCFVLDDPKCMRGIVDARSTTPLLVSIRIDLASKKQREVRLTIDWFAKGHSPVSARRTCDDCTENVLGSTLEAMLDDLSRSVPGLTGTLKITSTPTGLTILLDNKLIGVTPLDISVPIGSHKLQLARDGRTGPEQMIEVDGDKPIELELEAPTAGPSLGGSDGESSLPTPIAPTPQRRSRLLPGLMIGVGLAGIGAGAALYVTSEEPTGNGRTYRDTKSLGIGVAAGGGALLITGVIIIVATKSTTGPTVSMTPEGGATVGWAGSF